MIDERSKYPKLYASNVWLRHVSETLQKTPFCDKCTGQPAAIVTHKRLHRGCWGVLLDPRNTFVLCGPCYLEHKPSEG